MIVASGGSHRHVAALADHVVEILRMYGVRASVEGKTTCDWVLIDAGDLLVHIFRPEVRAFYGLEKMWGTKTGLEECPNDPSGTWNMTA